MPKLKSLTKIDLDELDLEFHLNNTVFEMG